MTQPSEAESRALTRPKDGTERSAFTWRFVRKHWPTAITTALVVLVGTVFFTLGQKRIYQAKATVLFDPTPPRPLGRRIEAVVDLGSGSFWDHQEYYETQYHIIRSRKVSLAVVNELGLHHDGAFLQNLPQGEAPDQAVSTDPELAAEALRGRLKVQAVRDSRLATVSFEDANPQRAQRLLTALVDTYVSANLDSALESTSSATSWLRTRLDGLKVDLESSEMALHAYKKDHNILSVDYSDRSGILINRMRHISDDLTSVNKSLDEAAAQWRELSKVRSNDPTVMEDEALLNSARLNQLRGAHHSAVADRDALLNQKRGPEHPKVKAVAQKVQVAERAILREIKNVQAAAKGRVRKLASTAGGLQARLAKTKTEALELNLLEIEYHRLRRHKDNTEKLYGMLMERTKEADLAQMMRINNVSVVDQPLVPQAHVRPRLPLNIALGLFGGVILGIAAAFGRSLVDRTVKVPDDLEADLGVTFLGLLPEFEGAKSLRPQKSKRKRHRGKLMPGLSPELIVHDQPTSSIAEAARVIRTNLMFMSPDDPHQLLLITSAGPSEGKTTVASSIAIAMAQAGQKVALIDCDLRRPRVHRIFGLSNETGLTTALLDGTIGDLVNDTRVDNLSVLPSGPVPPNPAELLHTAVFKRVLAELRERYDRVIIDSPPVAAVTDPAILSTLVDGTVLVARAFKTRKELARHAVRSIRDVGGHIAGSVLNAVNFSRLEYKYSYYYYRREGYYSDGPPSERQQKSPKESASNAPPTHPRA